MISFHIILLVISSLNKYTSTIIFLASSLKPTKMKNNSVQDPFKRGRRFLKLLREGQRLIGV
ncbi:hypothetical protein Hanom_Chr04g00325371 [Helianthus anomalus]